MDEDRQGAGDTQGNRKWQASNDGCDLHVPHLQRAALASARLDLASPSSMERMGAFSCPPSILEGLTYSLTVGPGDQKQPLDR